MHTFKAKGISKLKPDPEPATWEVAAVWPGDIRLTWELGSGDKKTRFTLASTGDRGWKSGTTIRPRTWLEVLNDVRADAYAIWVSTLTTLTDAETKLDYAGQSKLPNGDPVLGLKVSRRPWPDITLYFDAKSFSCARWPTARARPGCC